ncbi:MAG: hypothetical protein P9X24_01405 [Candidatus Hatepunaea meridiana]|nr:hypothetical protein [Candidatus Hatepunaea meridiana]
MLNRHSVIYTINLFILFTFLIGCESKKESASTICTTDGSILKDVPDWYTNIPENPDTVYSKGTALSSDMIEAKRKAKSIAINGLIEKYDISRGEIERLPRGVMIEKFILVKQKGKIRAYVLLKIAVDGLE